MPSSAERFCRHDFVGEARNRDAGGFGDETATVRLPVG